MLGFLMKYAFAYAANRWTRRSLVVLPHVVGIFNWSFMLLLTVGMQCSNVLNFVQVTVAVAFLLSELLQMITQSKRLPDVCLRHGVPLLVTLPE
jgi:hypothetical protein